MVKVNLNIQSLESAAKDAFKESCFLLGRTFTEVISEPGAFDGYDSDLVDTGAFRASQRLEFTKPGEARFSWSVEYAIYLLYGWTTRAGNEVPGRDWIAEGLKRQDLEKTIALLMKAKL